MNYISTPIIDLRCRSIFSAATRARKGTYSAGQQLRTSSARSAGHPVPARSMQSSPILGPPPPATRARPTKAPRSSVRGAQSAARLQPSARARRAAGTPGQGNTIAAREIISLGTLTWTSHTNYIMLTVQAAVQVQ